MAPNSKPPVCRVLDYSKYKYEQEQKAKAARKHQQQVNVREIKLRPKIATHDYETKKGHVERFLKQNDKVKVTIMFRGREQSHPERGRMLLDRLFEDVSELGDDRAGAPAGGPQHAHAAGPGSRSRPGKAGGRGELAGGASSTGAPVARRAGMPCMSASIVAAMPKMKTHSGSKKRFHKTATGKLRGRHANRSHILEKKTPKRKRQLGRPSEISKADRSRVKVLLPGKAGR